MKETQKAYTKMNWDSEKIIAFQKMQELANKKYRLNGVEVTNLYNSILNKKVTPTNCSSCINQRYQELKKSYNNFQKQLAEQEMIKAVEEVHTEPTPKEITIKKTRKKK